MILYPLDQHILAGQETESLVAINNG